MSPAQILGIVTLLILLIGFAIWIIKDSANALQRQVDTPNGPHHQDPASAEREILQTGSDPSLLLPLGWGVIVIGTIVELWAWFFVDVIPVGYSDTVNIDAVSQRSMLQAAGLVTALAGVMLASAGHVVNEVRRGR